MYITYHPQLRLHCGLRRMIIRCNDLVVDVYFQIIFFWLHDSLFLFYEGKQNQFFFSFESSVLLFRLKTFDDLLNFCGMETK